jgi:mono/diheme cytochrome c family protein
MRCDASTSGARAVRGAAGAAAALGLGGLALLAGAASDEVRDLVDRGRHLVEVVASCGECHTPITATGAPDTRYHLAGHIAGGPVPSPTSFKALTGHGVAYARNLTPDMETGLGTWQLQDFRRVLRQGVGKDGRTLNPYMPWQRFGRFLSDRDIEAIWAYLRSLPPVRNPVPLSDPFHPAGR